MDDKKSGDDDTWEVR